MYKGKLEVAIYGEETIYYENTREGEAELVDC